VDVSNFDCQWCLKITQHSGIKNVLNIWSEILQGVIKEQQKPFILINRHEIQFENFANNYFSFE